jgi:hypothetical protein
VLATATKDSCASAAQVQCTLFATPSSSVSVLSDNSVGWLKECDKEHAGMYPKPRLCPALEAALCCQLQTWGMPGCQKRDPQGPQCHTPGPHIRSQSGAGGGTGGSLSTISLNLTWQRTRNAQQTQVEYCGCHRAHSGENQEAADQHEATASMHCLPCEHWCSQTNVNTGLEGQTPGTPADLPPTCSVARLLALHASGVAPCGVAGTPAPPPSCSRIRSAGETA